MPKRNSPKDIKEIEDLNRLSDIVNDKRIAKRANAKKTRRDRHYEKQFIKNTLKTHRKDKLNMNDLEILTKLKVIVKPFVKNEESFENLTEDTDFINDLQINSANLVDIVLDTEEAFDIEIDTTSMEKMISIKATLEIIKTKLAAK